VAAASCPGHAARFLRVRRAVRSHQRRRPQPPKAPCLQHRRSPRGVLLASFGFRRSLSDCRDCHESVTGAPSSRPCSRHPTLHLGKGEHRHRALFRIDGMHALAASTIDQRGQQAGSILARSCELARLWSPCHMQSLHVQRPRRQATGMYNMPKVSGDASSANVGEYLCF
jgi:hypothetical protein